MHGDFIGEISAETGPGHVVKQSACDRRLVTAIRDVRDYLNGNAGMFADPTEAKRALATAQFEANEIDMDTSDFDDDIVRFVQKLDELERANAPKV